ncbi:TPA_asm: coat protein [Bacopa monnieri virus 3]|nr:TPA_asm: coat protein [Bacopa monnieri virus 3]
MNKNEKIIDKYNINYLDREMKIYKTDKNNEYVKNDGRYYLIIDREKLIIEQEYQRYIKLVKQNNTTEEIIEITTNNKSIDDLYRLIMEIKQDNDKKFSEINKNIHILNNNLITVKDKILRVEKETNEKFDIIKNNIENYIDNINTKISDIEFTINNNMLKELDKKDTDNTEIESEEDKSIDLEDLGQNSNQLNQFEVLAIEDSDKNDSIEDIDRYTGHDENELQSNLEVNMETEDDKKNIIKPQNRYPKPTHIEKTSRYIQDRKNMSYKDHRRQEKLWQSRLEYQPKPDNNPELLNLDCPIDIEEEIQNWVGITTTKIIENKITINNVHQYILGTITKSAKTYLNNLSTQENEILLSNRDLDGNAVTNPIDILRKFEILLRREFGNLNADAEELKEKQTNALKRLKGMKLCNMCSEYLNQYICDFRINYYKLNNEDKKRETRQLLYENLPNPINNTIISEYNRIPRSDTLGERISFLKTWYKSYCNYNQERKNINKTMRSADYCCEEQIPPMYGCLDNRYKFKKHDKRIKKYHKYKKRKHSYIKRYPNKKYFIKRKDYKRFPRNPKTCKCYNCGKIGHISTECKEKRKNNYNNNYIDIEILYEEMNVNEIPKNISIYECNEFEVNSGSDSQSEFSNTETDSEFTSKDE